jgi:hypothetical protein
MPIPLVKTMRCPECGKDDQTAKVSAIYIAGIEQSKSPEGSQPGSTQDTKGIPTGRLANLSRRLKPPSSGKQAVTRPVHPDSVILIFSLVLPIFLVGIGKSQPTALIPAVMILACFYGFYFWKRKPILAKFEREQENRKKTEEQVRTQLDRWMKLYYCARDDGIFSPEDGEITPADQIAGYLMKE